MRLVAEQLDRFQAPYVMFNQRKFACTEIEFEIAGGQIDGSILLDGSKYALQEFKGVFTRMMDDQSLPEIKGEPVDSSPRRHCRSVHEILSRWCEITPVRVVNRAIPQTS